MEPSPLDGRTRMNCSTRQSDLETTFIVRPLDCILEAMAKESGSSVKRKAYE